MSSDLIVRSQRVVVVDDAAEVRALVRLLLRGVPELELVGEGGDGDEAVRLAADLQPDLLLLDLSMPICDGLQALPRVLAVSPRTAVIVLTGFETAALREQCAALGASAYLSKRDLATTLVPRLRGEPLDTTTGGTPADFHG
jgi:DNA-binding NarL/FixJ family response regulator